jgi:branched-chain amino acid transport system permease protein
VYPTFLMKVLCFALFACAFNLLLGFAGLLSFGHAMPSSAARATSPACWCATWGDARARHPRRHAAAGAAGLGGRRAGDPPPGHLLRDDHAGAGADGVLLLPAVRSSPAARTACRACRAAICSASSTCRTTSRCTTWCSRSFCIGFWLIYRTIHSPFGQILKAIRENEPRAISLGYDVAKYKLLAFVLSAALAGMAGATKTLVFQLASLTDVHWHMSGEVVLMTLLGGLGTVLRPAGRRRHHRVAAEPSWPTASAPGSR